MQTIILVVLAVSAIGLAQDDKPPRFSIGLGVLAPSYSQKFAGNGRLDVDQDKNGFSYSLNNVPHAAGGSSASYQSQSNPQQFQSASAPKTGNDYGSPQGHFSIYSHRQIPKQSAEPAYSAPAGEDDGQYREQEQQSPAAHQSGQYNPSADQQYNQPSSGQSYNEPQNYNSEPDYKSEPQQAQAGQGGEGAQQSQPNFGNYNFEQQITHQFLDQQPLQLQAQSYQSQPQQYQPYQSQPSQPPTYQLQPSQHQPIQLQSRPIQTLRPIHSIQSLLRSDQPYNPHKQQQQIAYNPHQLHSLRV